mmetsp:Transcript_39603/g.76968  ORF Transcript_39603/g.76968 Transcript_39603/m.76968 type:complete len:245 (+) Transcript_39603:764-1498(+)
MCGALRSTPGPYSVWRLSRSMSISRRPQMRSSSSSHVSKDKSCSGTIEHMPLRIASTCILVSSRRDWTTRATSSWRLSNPMRMLLLPSLPNSVRWPRSRNGDWSLLVSGTTASTPNCSVNALRSRADGEWGSKGSSTFFTSATSMRRRSISVSGSPESCFHTSEAKSNAMITCVRIAIPISWPTNSYCSICCTLCMEGCGMYLSRSSPIRNTLFGVGMKSARGYGSSGPNGSWSSRQMSEKKAR